MSRKYVIYLDPGHGIETEGKRSPMWSDGRELFEHELNLDVANRVAAELQDTVTIIPTRTDTKDIPLSKRVDIANSTYQEYDKALFVSIHANLGGGTGWEVFTSVGETESDVYATLFYEEVRKLFPDMTYRLDWSDSDPDKEIDFYVLRKTKMPAVLTENFFMDTLNPDCEILMSEEGRQKIAMAHVNAIHRIIKIWDLYE